MWVINGFFVWLPLVRPPESFAGESAWGGGITALVGATIFELGSVLLMLEAVNESRSDCFGWAVEEAVEEVTGKGAEVALGLGLKPHRDGCRHSHAQRRGWLAPGGTDYRGGAAGAERQGESSEGAENSPGDQQSDTTRNSCRRQWQWWPSLDELRTHYIHDIGFLACASQMVGATVFWTAGFTGIPPIIDTLSTPATNGAYWLPQVCRRCPNLVQGPNSPSSPHICGLGPRQKFG